MTSEKKQFQTGKEALEHYVPGYKVIRSLDDDDEDESKASSDLSQESRRLLREFAKQMNSLLLSSDRRTK